MVKTISVIAPLLGLLGTVTGMIQTFQAITLFGTGDPKMMAGGISEALVTTMLGLTTAIPLVLLSDMLSNSTRRILDVLDEQSAGLIATRSEKASWLISSPSGRYATSSRRGGNVLFAIALVTAVMWALIIERFFYFRHVPGRAQARHRALEEPAPTTRHGTPTRSAGCTSPRRS